MNVSIYLLLGFLDVFSVIYLMFSFFSLPTREYIKEIAVIAAALSLSSYLVRIVFGLPLIDTLIQAALIIVLIRFLVKVKTALSVLITAVGFLAYMFLQPLILYLLTFSGAIAADVAPTTDTWGIRMVQLVTDTALIGISLLIARFGLSVTYFMRPPHTFFIKERLSREFFVIVAAACFGLTLSCALMYLLLEIRFLLIPPIALSILIVLILFVLRRDYYSHVLGFGKKNG